MVVELADPLVQSLLVGLVTNGLYSLILQTGNALKDVSKIVRPPKPAAITAVSLAFNQLQKSIESDANAPEQPRLISFFKSPEAEAAVRQVFATSFAGTAKQSTLESVRREFLASMSLYVEIEEENLKPFCESVLDAVIDCAGVALQSAIQRNILPAHEAMDAARQNMILDEIANLKENVKLLARRPQFDVQAILAFEEKYREMVGSVHAFIKPPDLESGRRVPIDEIFVAPQLLLASPQKSKEWRNVDLRGFLAGLHRVVLLGNPGGGKSTVSAKICHDLVNGYADRLLAGRELTPVLVVLREYGSQKKSSGCSIAQFIESQASSRYQISPPQHAFEYLLRNGRLFVIFDGLDELLDTAYRQEITSNVETFCKLYASVPVLVTSREVGYEQAPLNEKAFQLSRLAPFNDEQVKDYARKWFARDEEFTQDQKNQKAASFIADSGIAPDLRSNPLMLGLMCNLYRAEGYIPRNRPEVYSKCSVMLFEKWDKARDILVPLPFEEHLRPAMEDLAFWIYSNEELQGGVTESRLVDRASDFLRQWVFDNALKATQAAQEFIQFCRGRAWVFTDTGSTKDGEGLYQFTHRTFLEYFTACHLASIYPTPEPLSEYLKPRIRRREWDVVAQLAFQIQSKRVQGAADKLLSTLLADESAQARERWNSLSFAERCLEFLVPSPRTRREVAKAAFAFWVSAVLGGVRIEPTPSGQKYEPLQHIENLLRVASENRPTIGEEAEAFLKEGIASADPKISALAAELAYSLTSARYLTSDGQLGEDAQRFWGELSERVLQETEPKLREIGLTNQTVALRQHRYGQITLDEMAKRFGPAGILLPITNWVRDSLYFPVGFSIANVATAFNARSPKDPDPSVTRDLDTLSTLFLTWPTPWITRRDDLATGGSWMIGFAGSGRRLRGTETKLSESADFALACLLAFDLELQWGQSPQFPLPDIRESMPEITDLMKLVLNARDSRAERAKSVEALRRMKLHPSREQFLSRWISGKSKLIA